MLSTAASPSASGGATVSAVIIAQNEEARIEQAVASCAAFADEVVVVDGGSTDATVEICQRLGARVYVNSWPGYAAQRNFAVSKCIGDWIFALDADEVVDATLGREIRETVDQGTTYNAFSLPRVGDFFGRWMGPDTQVRLIRRSQAFVADVRVHEGFAVPRQQLGQLTGILWHYGFRSLSDHLRRFDRYTSLEADEAYISGRRFSVIRLVVRPPGHLMLELVARKLYRKGIAGLTVAIFWGLYEFLTEVKLYEKQWRARGNGGGESHDRPVRGRV